MLTIPFSACSDEHFPVPQKLNVSDSARYVRGTRLVLLALLGVHCSGIAVSPESTELDQRSMLEGCDPKEDVLLLNGKVLE
eukprot:2283405-Rhodomonas_salina.2